MKNRISIIVVCYNHSKYVIDCLESILHQTYKNIQLLIVDDCSTDNSVEVISDWVQKNKYECTKIFQKENIGLIRNLNSCFEMIEGDFVRIIAADDFLHPESCEKSISKLLELGSDYGMVFSNVHTIDADNNILKEGRDFDKYQYFNQKQLKQELLKGNIVCAPSVVMTRSALIETGKYPEDFIVEDYYKWLKISEKYSLAYIPEKLIFYRNHGSNLTFIKSKRINEEDLLLKITFDHEGLISNFIEEAVRELYYKGLLTERICKSYKKYRNKDKLLSFCISNNLYFMIYRVLRKILR